MSELPGVPREFVAILNSLRNPAPPRGIHVAEVPGPSRLAPWTLALTAEANLSADLDPDTLLGDGRFIVLHDPACPAAWNGDSRVVVLARARVDDDIASDPLFAEAVWTWLTDPLGEHAPGSHSLTGTVTRTESLAFGDMALHSRQVEIEVRASWTASGYDLAPDFAAFIELVANCAGLEPEIEGVSPLRPRLTRPAFDYLR